MKKVIYISIILILSLFSCNQREEKNCFENEIYYYPERGKFNDRTNLSDIFIEDIEDYSELLKEIDRIACKDSIPIINYSTKKAKFKLFPWYECSENNIVSCPTFRSRIFIQNDTILTNYKIKHSIDSLGIILKRHLLNNGKDFNYSDSPDRAGIEVYFEGKTKSDEFEDFLINLSEKFNQLNKENVDTLYLKIYFRDRPLRMVPMPPPPPPKQN
ncbi:hypothetical protein [Gramella sp. MAR_2010_147]|uniref:hypothetical protein n=1 Tax=Gramella sp. MAR_2010_147 TaxID=1250205 RepID=UPI00087AF9F5|nr:hypothetical protein [Gramella sp. MAR_2010_147]SDS63860.1 hypothetical protein SAMN04488553_2729 [Gramella sp. MAR_2010_147]